MKFVVEAPTYTDRSAGIAALHRLGYWLNELGHDTRMHSGGTNPEWGVPLLGSTRITPDTVVVYPEIVKGNPLGGSRVARWALCHPGFYYFRSPEVLDSADAICYYANRFRASTERAASGNAVHRLFVSVYDPKVFYSKDGVRERDAYYIGRGSETYKRYGKLVSLGSAEQMLPKFATRFDVAEYLRGTRRLYVFDQVTALLAESMLCGVKAVLVKDDGNVVTCDPAGDECMGVFEDPDAFNKPGDVEEFVRLFQ